MLKQQLTNFTVQASYPYVPLRNRSIETGKKLDGIFEEIPATVPGSVYLDLIKAGLLEDPLYEMNSLSAEWVANKWWIYKSNFNFAVNRTKRQYLRFEGIDYVGRIYLNGQFLARHEGMNLPIEIEVTDIIKEQNQIIVVIEDAPNEIPQIGFTSMSTTQKPRFSYKWDFSTRLVNVGLYKEVYLIERSDIKIEDTQISYKVVGKNANIIVKNTVFCNKSGEYDIALSVGESKKSKSINLVQGYNDIEIELQMSDIKLWWSNGSGEANLYDLLVEVLQNGEISDIFSVKFGVKELTFRKNANSADSSLPYTFVLNGKPIYIKGVNYVPLDMFYGSQNNQKLVELLDLIKFSGVNFIRVWGGALIESDFFYEECAKRGILVWQEFLQSSSGIENVPSEDKLFLNRLEKVSVHAVKTLRNHVALSAWSGGNELSDKKNIPITFENNVIKKLKDIVDKYDNGRMMFASSPSGPNFFLDPLDKGNNHDVHGFWKYDGEKEYLKFFNESDSLFHSEFGCDAVSNLPVLKRILSDKNLVVTDALNNEVWRHHGEYWDTLNRDETFFGKINSLEDYIVFSQYIQYEAVRYALEANRRRAFNNSGSIVWQINEPFPNASCTNLVDYFNKPKMAYYALKIAFQSVVGTAKYDKLIYNRDENVEFSVYLTSDEQTRLRNVDVIITTSDARLLFKETLSVVCGNGESVFAKKYSYPMPKSGNLILNIFGEEGSVNRIIFFARDDGKIEQKTALADIGYVYKLAKNCK